MTARTCEIPRQVFVYWRQALAVSAARPRLWRSGRTWSPTSSRNSVDLLPGEAEATEKLASGAIFDNPQSEAVSDVIFLRPVDPSPDLCGSLGVRIMAHHFPVPAESNHIWQVAISHFATRDPAGTCRSHGDRAYLERGSHGEFVRDNGAMEEPDRLPRYHMLTGFDDAAFCRRGGEALELSYSLYGS